jgi:periplasmic protein TonB
MLRRAGLICICLASACSRPEQRAGDQTLEQPQPDERPLMVNTELPFHYPGALYARKLQGNVTLRLFVDVNGQTVPESTKVEESSGQLAFDTAAVAGSRDLRFVPAKLRGEPMGMTILFPVYFRHPEAPALPGDSALKKNNRG